LSISRGHAAGAGRRRGDDFIAAELADQRPARLDLVGAQVGGRDEAAVALHFGFELRSNGALVELAGAALGNLLQGIGEVLLLEGVARSKELAVAQKNLSALGEPAELGRGVDEVVGQPRADGETFVGQTNGRLITFSTAGCRSFERVLRPATVPGTAAARQLGAGAGERLPSESRYMSGRAAAGATSR
jgi:hypothetical protein